MEQKFLSVREVAKRLNIGVSTLYRLIKQGLFIQGGYFGGSRRFNIDEVDAWAQAKAQAQTGN